MALGSQVFGPCTFSDRQAPWLAVPQPARSSHSLIPHDQRIGRDRTPGPAPSRAVSPRAARTRGVERPPKRNGRSTILVGMMGAAIYLIVTT
jgi:hypothetical protein